MFYHTIWESMQGLPYSLKRHLVERQITFPFIKKFFQEPQFYLFLHFWLHWIFAAALRLSLVAATKGYSSHAVASLVAEHELWSAQASVVAAPRL